MKYRPLSSRRRSIIDRYENVEQKQQSQTTIRNFFLATKQRPISSSSSSSLSISTKLTSDKESSPNASLRPSIATAQQVVIDRERTSLDSSVTTESPGMIAANSTTKLFGNSGSKKRKRRIKGTSEQLYIDVGQKDFAATQICPICNMLTVHGIESDIQQHRKLCNQYQDGVVWSSMLSSSKSRRTSDKQTSYIHEQRGSTMTTIAQQTQLERICLEWILPANKSYPTKAHRPVQSKLNAITNATNGIKTAAAKISDQLSAFIIEIRPGTYSKNHKRLDLVRTIVNEELGFVQNNNINNGSRNNKDTKTTYLCIVNQRVVGMVIVEEISSAYQLMEPLASSTTETATTTNHSNTTSTCNVGLTRSIHATKAALGIYQLWVHNKYRCRGIATSLVDTARKHMYYGYTSIPIQQVAFSSPTESGIAFAKQYNIQNKNTKSVLVYDCY